MHFITTLFFIVAIFAVLSRVKLRDFHVERSITINRPRDDVFAYLRMIRNNVNWNAWALKDPAAERDFRGIDGTVGATATWKSANREVGTGEQEIMEIIDGQKLTCQIRLLAPFRATFPSVLQTRSLSLTQTEVTMIMHDKIRFPMGVICMFMNQNKKIAADFDTSLANLKAELEK
jgi:hypothetical protein